jgi:hypothetical protein
MKFYANQNVRIVTVGEVHTVTALQAKSTPGAYSIFRAKEGQHYTISIEGSHGKVSGKLVCWTREHRYDKKPYSTTVPINLGKNGEIVTVPYHHSAQTGDIRIGVLFSRCSRGDYFSLKKIQFHASHERSGLYDTTEAPPISRIMKEEKLRIEKIHEDEEKSSSEEIKKVEESVAETAKSSTFVNTPEPPAKKYKTTSPCCNKVLTTKRTLYWEEPNLNKRRKIEMTVALPAKRANKIIWLALESLSRQTNITFGWELLIWEDTSNSRLKIEPFIGRLPGCQRVVYRTINPVTFGHRTGNLKGTFPLVDKWIGMAHEATDTSRIFVLHACDCYSPPKRLFIHYTHFKNRACYFSTQPRGLFFNLLTREKMFYAPYDSPTANPIKRSVTHLNMALRTCDMRKMRPRAIRAGIDGYILAHIKRLRRIRRMQAHIFHDFTVDKNSWMYGLDTDGANNISWKRKKFYKKPYTHLFHFFVPYNGFKRALKYDKPEKYLPPEVIEFILNYKKNRDAQAAKKK